eukprot:CFRG0562T1
MAIIKDKPSTSSAHQHTQYLARLYQARHDENRIKVSAFQRMLQLEQQNTMMLKIALYSQIRNKRQYESSGDESDSQISATHIHNTKFSSNQVVPCSRNSPSDSIHENSLLCPMEFLTEPHVHEKDFDNEIPIERYKQNALFISKVIALLDTMDQRVTPAILREVNASISEALYDMIEYLPDNAYDLPFTATARAADRLLTVLDDRSRVSLSESIENSPLLSTTLHLTNALIKLIIIAVGRKVSCVPFCIICVRRDGHVKQMEENEEDCNDGEHPENVKAWLGEIVVRLARCNPQLLVGVLHQACEIVHEAGRKLRDMINNRAEGGIRLKWFSESWEDTYKHVFLIMQKCLGVKKLSSSQTVRRKHKQSLKEFSRLLEESTMGLSSSSACSEFLAEVWKVWSLTKAKY